MVGNIGWGLDYYLRFGFRMYGYVWKYVFGESRSIFVRHGYGYGGHRGMVRHMDRC